MTGGRARRDPEGRRRVIVEAAAALVAEAGLDGLSHRRVAERAGVPLGSTTYYFASLEELGREALAFLSDQVVADLREVADALEAAGAATPEVLGGLLHAYVSDRARVRSDAATYAAAIHQEDLRLLALRWFEGLVEVLSGYIDPQAALAMAVFSDGAAMHAVLHDEPLSLAFMTETAARLLADRDAKDVRA